MNDLWTGLWEIEAPIGCTLLEGARGAFVNAVGIAEDQSIFVENTARVLGAWGLEVRNCEAIRRTRLEELKDPALHRAAESLIPGAVLVAFGEFHTFSDLPE